MSEQLKFIVDNLNQKPFNKSYNLIRYVTVYCNYCLTLVIYKLIMSRRKRGIVVEGVSLICHVNTSVI